MNTIWWVEQPFMELADGKGCVSEEKSKSDVECVIFPIIPTSS
jgi:hypothetical protein